MLSRDDLFQHILGDGTLPAKAHAICIGSGVRGTTI